SNLVLAEILLDPAAFAVLVVVSPGEGEGAHDVGSSGLQLAVVKGEVKRHRLPAGEQMLHEEAGPRAGGEPGIGFQFVRIFWGHGSPLIGKKTSYRWVPHWYLYSWIDEIPPQGKVNPGSPDRWA